MWRTIRYYKQFQMPLTQDQGQSWNMLNKSGSELMMLFTTFLCKQNLLSDLVKHNVTFIYLQIVVSICSSKNQCIVSCIFLWANILSREMTKQLEKLKWFRAVSLACVLALKAQATVWSTLHKGHTTNIVAILLSQRFTAEQGPANGPVNY